MGASLGACETTPKAGSLTRAQVLEVVKDRHLVRDGHPELYAAIRAGVTRQAIAAGQLIGGECGIPDRTQASGARWFTVTVLVPAGVRLANGTVVLVRDLRTAWPVPDGGTPERLHGVYAGPASDPRAPRPTVEPGTGCQEPDMPPGHWRVKLRGPVPAWAFDFADAGLHRLDALRDSDLAAGRVIRVSCQLKLADGGDWYAPIWVANVPEPLRLQAGDVVRVRVGPEAASKDPGPPAQVLERVAGETVSGQRLTLRCGS